MDDSPKTRDHSDIVGGSTAARLLACPGSYQMQQKLPPSVIEAANAYADEGTALHEAMHKVFENCLIFDNPIGLEGATMSNGVKIEKGMIDDLLHPTLKYLESVVMHEAFNDESFQYFTEEHVEFPGIEGAFGTLDLAVSTRDRLALFDYKFGRGVEVKALYPDDERGDLINSQLLFYACGLRHIKPDLFNGVECIELHIVQPAFSASMIEVEPEELDAFERALKAAVKKAKAKDPPIARGDHCRFAPCKVICPKWTAPLLDMDVLARAIAKGSPKQDLALYPVADQHEDYARALSTGLRLAPLIETVLADYRAQAHSYLEAGHIVPGFKLVPKRAVRKWLDENDAGSALRKLGLPLSTILEQSVISPAGAEKALKGIRKELPAELWSAVSSGTTVAPETDSRPVQSLADAIRDMASALSKLVKPEKAK